MEQQKETINSASQNMTDADIQTKAEITPEIREQIEAKIKQIKTEKNLKKVYAIVVQGDDGDDKPFYIGYFKRPSFSGFSMWANQVQKDSIVANKLLAEHCFVGGDSEVYKDDDLFCFGTMQHISDLIESRKSDLVKL